MLPLGHPSFTKQCRLTTWWSGLPWGFRFSYSLHFTSTGGRWESLIVWRRSCAIAIPIGNALNVHSHWETRSLKEYAFACSLIARKNKENPSADCSVQAVKIFLKWVSMTLESSFEIKQQKKETPDSPSKCWILLALDLDLDGQEKIGLWFWGRSRGSKRMNSILGSLYTNSNLGQGKSKVWEGHTSESTATACFLANLASTWDSWFFSPLYYFLWDRPISNSPFLSPSLKSWIKIST